MDSKDLAIDFGTSAIKIFRRNEGVVVNQRNVIAIQNKKNIIAIGDEAYDMMEKSPDNVEVGYPVIDGVIADIHNMKNLLNQMIKKINKNKKSLGKANFYVAVPTDITDVEKRAFSDLIANSNAKTKNIKIVEKPIADALGAGLDVNNAKGIMIVDVGADTTEISVMSLGGIVLSKLLKIGGNQLDDSVKTSVRKSYNLIIGNKTAELIKKELSCAYDTEERTLSVYGRNLVTGLPIKVEISSKMVYDAIKEYLYNIVDAIKIILERTPPELAADIIDSGIFLTGGSAHIEQFDKLISKETDLTVNVCDDYEMSVINGLGKVIEQPEFAELASALRQTTYH